MEITHLGVGVDHDELDAVAKVVACEMARGRGGGGGGHGSGAAEAAGTPGTPCARVHEQRDGTFERRRIRSHTGREGGRAWRARSHRPKGMCARRSLGRSAPRACGMRETVEQPPPPMPTTLSKGPSRRGAGVVGASVDAAAAATSSAAAFSLSSSGLIAATAAAMLIDGVTAVLAALTGAWRETSRRSGDADSTGCAGDDTTSTSTSITGWCKFQS